VAIAALTLGYWQLSAAHEFTAAGDEVPGCDRSATTKLLKSAITGSPLGRTYNVAVFGVAFISEDQSSSFEKRVCFGTIFTNSGPYEIIYIVERTGDAKAQLSLEADILPSNYL
jgi:hypothetical protein